MRMMKLIFLSLLSFGVLTACETEMEIYDLVIANGRAIDPETGLDAVRHIGIRDGHIDKISTTPLLGKKTLDAKDRVVSAGFIDVHNHSPTNFATRFQILDGITTQLDLEAGSYPLSGYGFMFEKGALNHYGSSTSHLAVRLKVMENIDHAYLFTPDGTVLKPGLTFVQQATQTQIEAMRPLLEKGLEEGGIGIGLLLDYVTRAVSDDELRMIFEVAAKYDKPITVHVRRGLPGDMTGLLEIITLAEATGAPVMICHITHSAMHNIGNWLALIDAANERGARITTETLSWAAGGTAIGADVFGRNWQEIFNITYSDVQWTATGEWLTKESWEQYRTHQPNGMINHHYVKEAWMEEALRWPQMIISSDVTPAFNRKIMSNPNLSGTFSRLLGHYVRTRGVLSLNDAIARITLYPAQWLEPYAPIFKNKGRLQEGKHADIVIFNPDTIAAQADYGKPYKASTGIDYVIVSGVIVAEHGAIKDHIYPGQRLTTKTE